VWDMAKEVLVNVVFILLPLLFYLVFLRHKEGIRQKSLQTDFLITMAFALILTMLFPAKNIDGYGYDLKMIPIILTFAYIGIWPGISLVLLMLGITVILYPTSLPIKIENYIIVTILLSIISRNYHRFTLNKKILYLSLLYCGIIISRCLYLYINEDFPQLYFSLYLSLITWTTLICGIFLIENREKQLILQRELEQNEKMSALSQLAASIAHEIRNPMTTVRGFLQLLANSNSLSDKDVSFVKLSISELDRAQNIINNFLSFSKPDDKEVFQMFDLSQAILDAVNILSSYAMLNNVRMDSDVDTPLFINGFKNEMQQVLINLMKNAIESMINGGTLEITAYKKKQVNIVEIKDNGCGMSPEKLQKIGTPYYSTKEKGTGLGLMISFEIIRRMNGKIHVSSELNVGTTFTLQFPAPKN
jgi:two-component system, sporulation sensor kinase B